jgi:hypothetical protein
MALLGDIPAPVSVTSTRIRFVSAALIVICSWCIFQGIIKKICKYLREPVAVARSDKLEVKIQ